MEGGVLSNPFAMILDQTDHRLWLLVKFLQNSASIADICKKIQFKKTFLLKGNFSGEVWYLFAVYLSNLLYGSTMARFKVTGMN